jgi:uncharacterized protein
MVQRRAIEEYASRIAREFKPRRIVLFGSYAYGQPTEDSDVDLLVVLPHRGNGIEAALRIRNRVDAPFALDLIVRSPAKMRERLRLRDCFIREIVTRGKVLYEA